MIVIFFNEEGAGLLALQRCKRKAKSAGFLSVKDAEEIAGIFSDCPDDYEVTYGWTLEMLKKDAKVERASKTTELFKWQLYLPETIKKERKRKNGKNNHI